MDHYFLDILYHEPLCHMSLHRNPPANIITVRPAGWLRHTRHRRPEAMSQHPAGGRTIRPDNPAGGPTIRPDTTWTRQSSPGNPAAPVDPESPKENSVP